MAGPGAHQLPESSDVSNDAAPPMTARRIRRRWRALVVVLAAAGGVAGCRDGGGGDTAQFCEMVQTDIGALRSEPTTAQEVESLIDLWREVGDEAPLAIETDWSAIVLMMETAWTGEDQEEAFARIYATERSSVAVARWLSDNCAIDFGPVSTISPPAVSTTSGGPTTTAPPA